MRYLYSLGIWMYWLLVRVASMFNEKAKFFVDGRLGLLDKLKQQIDPNAKYIWFHVASLGEFEQGRPIMERIKQEHPDYKILLTFFSPSGYEIRKNYNGADVICYLPMDTVGNAKKFLAICKPQMAVFVKYEYWINYLHELKAADIPTYMVSAIFLPTQAFFKWYGGWYRNVLTTFKHLFVQDEQSVNLLKTIGVENATACGDTRFDRVLAIAQNAKKLPICEAFKRGEQPILIAGSSWPKDEDLLATYFNQKDYRIIIAPHETDDAHVEEIISKLKRKCVRYTKATEQSAAEADVLIIDCIGILSSIYQYGELAYIGGGFGVGIHNILEPAVYGMPVVFGPNYHKFREAVEMEKAGGAFHIEDLQQLTLVLDSLMTPQSARLAETSAIAKQFVAANSGATDLIMKHLFN
ncbi:MAG: 3-deoxy-D-manno-octulosonic acid transferase [Paludibacteraceae bacterium]|nr:3-deoxy-D-manno-octulosonic acid transferase [Paludibacteraceae bacterium]